MKKKLLNFLTIALSMQLLYPTTIFTQEDPISITLKWEDRKHRNETENKWSYISNFLKCLLDVSVIAINIAQTVYIAQNIKKNPNFTHNSTQFTPKKPVQNPTTTPITFEPYIQEHIDIITNYFTQGTKKIADKVPLTDADIPVGMVLHGPPGTGKTMFAKALLQKGIPLFEIAGIESMWIGQSEANLRNAYEEAKKYLNTHDVPFVVVFIDEADSFLSKRSSGDMAVYDKHNNKLVDEFLRLTDGLDDTSKRIVTIVSTNHYNSLDDAAIRAGRLTKKIKFKKISNDMARSIFDTSFAQLDKKASPELTEFLKEHFNTIKLSSAAEWATVPRVAYEFALLEESSAINVKHFLKAILSVNPENPHVEELLKTINTQDKN